MNTKIIVEKRVYSNLVKLAIETRKLLIDISERPEFNKEWLSINDIETEYKLSRKIIDSYRRKGLKFHQKVPNGKILVRRSELDKFIVKK